MEYQCQITFAEGDSYTRTVSSRREKKTYLYPSISVTLKIRQCISPVIKLTLLSIKQLIKFTLYLVDAGY